MISKAKKFIKKNDHILLLGSLVFFIAAPIWQSIIPRSEFLIEIAILLIILSGLSVTVFQGKSRFNMAFYFGVFVIFSSLIDFIFNLGNQVHTLIQYLDVVFFLILTFILFNVNIKAHSVNTEVIVNSISGYLLLGISWAIVVAIAGNSNPNAFSINITEGNAIFDEIYFSFVTLATLGYGDILPVTPEAKVISIFIAITGAFYNTIVLGLIVGKFISTQTNNSKSQN